VLANEQVHDGGCERCGTTVFQKNLTQWFFKITSYAEELLDGLNKINWPDKTKLMQRNWIGKSIGTEVNFKVDGSDETITVFTTRPDTLFGVTYVVIAPEHPLVDKLTTHEFKESVDAYKDSIKSLTEIERTSTVKEKTGVPIGAYAINPVNNEKVPIWIADYALLTYGTGCVMAVPGHDERDFEFAKKFELPIRKVILEAGKSPDEELTGAFVEVGTMINSAQFDGFNSDEGIEKVSDFLEEKNLGKRKTNYRLRDWLISRQRYWGTPIPVIHCPECGLIPVPEEELPVELPYDIEFKPTGESPLAGNDKFINVKCPKCGADSKRDPDTMDTFVDSSWYYFRYLNPNFSDGIFDKEVGNTWTPVDMYVGGAEHATMHLLYARFIHKFLRDIGMTNSDEPFQTLIHQGTITNQGAKMSKSKGNVINPDDYIKNTGSDVFRLYLMFMGPYEMGGDWSDKGISGTERFVIRTYDLFNAHTGIVKSNSAESKYDLQTLSNEENLVYRKINQTIVKYNVELEHFRFNTAIASLMELLNELTKNLAVCRKDLISYVLERYVVLLGPVAPHLAEECWQIAGNNESLFEKPVWFEPDAVALVEDTVSIAVQINGKLRGTIDVPMDSDEQFVKTSAYADERITKYTEGKTIVKEIFVKNKILNVVVK
jgi:leucyl-tRNA synthetase